MAESTIRLRTYLLELLERIGCDLLNPESVETVLATEKLTQSQKHQYVAVYRSFTKTMNIPWTPIKVRYKPKQPFLPTEAEIDMLIHAASKRTSTFLQVAKDTGARVGEISKLKRTDVNTENCTISINSPEKGSRSRTIKVTQKTIAMIDSMPKKYGDYVFNPNPTTIKTVFQALRDRLSVVHHNPRLKQIHLHSFRHWKATKEYHRTKSLEHVKYLLGHKNVQNTDLYTHLVDFMDDQYYSAVAKTIQEAQKLVED